MFAQLRQGGGQLGRRQGPGEAGGGAHVRESDGDRGDPPVEGLLALREAVRRLGGKKARQGGRLVLAPSDRGGLEARLIWSREAGRDGGP